MGADSMLAEARAAWGDEVLRRRIAAARMDRVERWAGCLSERRLLDIGCGPGDVVVEAARRGWLVTGVDDRPEVRRRLRAAGFAAVADVAHAIASTAPRPQMVTMFRSLERAADPVSALAEAAEVLAPGGVLVVEVSEPAGWMTPRHGSRTPQWSRSTPEHGLFSVERLDRAISECGLDSAWSGREALWVGPSRVPEATMSGLLSSAAVLEQVARIRLGRRCVRRVYGDLITIVARKR